VARTVNMGSGDFDRRDLKPNLVVLPFGKFKGWTIKKIANDSKLKDSGLKYLQWLRDESWFKEKFPLHYAAIELMLSDPKMARKSFDTFARGAGPSHSQVVKEHNDHCPDLPVTIHEQDPDDDCPF
jgi:hypothetical protein